MKRMAKKSCGLTLAVAFGSVLIIVALAITFLSGIFDSNEIAMESIQQEPELPQGCEVTSLAMVLKYYGFDVDKTTLADTYLPKTADYHSANPNTHYIGDPRGKGWYCFSAPVVVASNQFLASQDTSLQAYDVNGITSKEIKKYIDDGIPVIIWSTLNFEEPKYSSNTTWILNSEQIVPYTNLHVVVIYGYDPFDFKFIDPQGGYASVGKDELLQSNQSIGSYAVVVK